MIRASYPCRIGGGEGAGLWSTGHAPRSCRFCPRADETASPARAHPRPRPRGHAL